MENKETISFEFTKGGIVTDFKISDNFNTEEAVFEDLAFYLAGEYNCLKNEPRVHLSLLEKLEILCKRARNYADEESEFDEKYTEIRFLMKNEMFSLDKSGSLNTEYDSIRLLTNNLIVVEKNGFFGLIDKKGDVVLSSRYSSIYLLEDHLIKTTIGEKYFLYDLKGKELSSDLDDVSENFNPFGVYQSFFWLKKDNKWGLFDSNLRQILPFSLDYDYCELLIENDKATVYIKVFKNKKCGLINGLLNVVVLPLDSEIENISISGRKDFIITKRNNEKITISQDSLIKTSQNNFTKN